MKNDESRQDENEEQELSEIVFSRENSVSLAKRKAGFFFTNITLEPVMLFYGVIRSIDRVAQSQLILGRGLIIQKIYLFIFFR